MNIPTPEDYLGFTVGADKSLADWNQIVGYFDLLRLSPRFLVEEIGTSTEGRPFLLAIITSPGNHARLEELRLMQSCLADPRGLKAEDASKLIDAGKSIVLITLSIHATEVGGSQMGLELAYELATKNDSETLEILNNTILLLVPSLNPDGLDLVVDWYNKTLNTPFEGTTPPFLYQKYTGHDNNRDWFMFTQTETRLVVEHIHNRWHPHIVLDQHQQGPDGPRMVLPPFIDPYDNNVDPIIRQEVAWLGQAVAAELTGQGKAGVMTNVIYDGFSPSRAYQHYHGGVRILSEAASVNIASPVRRTHKELVAGRGFDPKVATWNHPEPWPGGEWHLRDIVDYNKVVAWACLSHAAKYRRQWLNNFFRIGQRAIEPKQRVYAYLIPLEQRDPKVAAELLGILAFGGVEIHSAQKGFIADGVDYRPGTYIIRMDQPYSSFAKTMLEKQEYPDLRLYPGGPPKRPYDITAHSLPIQMGVSAVEVLSPFETVLELVRNIPAYVSPPMPRRIEGEWIYIRAEANRSYSAIFRLLALGVDVYRLRCEHERPVLPAGTIIVPHSAAPHAVSLSMQWGLRIGGLTDLDLALLEPIKRMPQVGIYKSFVPNADEGWLRYVLEEYEIPYTTLSDIDIRKGSLHEAYDCIIMPSAPSRTINEGLSAKYPAEYCGGLGLVGIDAMRAFVEEGGSVVALDASCDWAIQELCLPVNNVSTSVSDSEFYIPGSFLRVVMDTNHPLGYGMSREAAVVFVRSPVFDVDAKDSKVVARYPMANPLLSGWALGTDRLHGRAALVECVVGKGKAVLIGFRPHHRAQARGTYKVLFNSLLQ